MSIVTGTWTGIGVKHFEHSSCNKLKVKLYGIVLLQLVVFFPSSFHFGNVFEMIAINCLFVLKFEIMESNQFIFFDFDINVFAMCGSGL